MIIVSLYEILLKHFLPSSEGILETNIKEIPLNSLWLNWHEITLPIQIIIVSQSFYYILTYYYLIYFFLIYMTSTINIRSQPGTFSQVYSVVDHGSVLSILQKKKIINSRKSRFRKNQQFSVGLSRFCGAALYGGASLVHISFPNVSVPRMQRKSFSRLPLIN